VLRLEQALGTTPEPISPNKTLPHFGVRISFPEPIGLAPDITAAFDKLVQRLCDHLKHHGKGARHLRVDFLRCDDTSQTITLGLARATDDPDRIRPLFDVRLPDVDPGFGIDIIRLEATQTEPLHRTQAVGHLEAGRQVAEWLQSQHALDDLLARLATRVGSDNVIRLHPNDSHIPENNCVTQMALYSAPSPDWPLPPRPRPLLLWPPEFVHPADAQRPPKSFRWRGRSLSTRFARGPERIAPQWWIDDPNWRSGVRDYWHITCDSGDVLWIFYAHGGTVSGGWFCHGRFG
jgi:protein ImuB